MYIEKSEYHKIQRLWGLTSWVGNIIHVFVYVIVDAVPPLLDVTSDQHVICRLPGDYSLAACRQLGP